MDTAFAVFTTRVTVTCQRLRAISSDGINERLSGLKPYLTVDVTAVSAVSAIKGFSVQKVIRAHADVVCAVRAVTAPQLQEIPACLSYRHIAVLRRGYVRRSVRGLHCRA